MTTKPLLYKLYAIQSFSKELYAVYIKVGDFPDPEVLTDSIEISKNNLSITDLKRTKPWKYTKDYFNGASYSEYRSNMLDLTRYSMLFKRSIRILEAHDNIDKALFMESRLQVDWHGEQDVYLNRNFSIYKSSFPTYSSCEFLKKINL